MQNDMIVIEQYAQNNKKEKKKMEHGVQGEEHLEKEENSVITKIRENRERKKNTGSVMSSKYNQEVCKRK